MTDHDPLDDDKGTWDERLGKSPVWFCILLVIFIVVGGWPVWKSWGSDAGFLILAVLAIVFIPFLAGLAREYLRGRRR
jgi:ABC-type methionine transport system permease subunit